MSAEELAFIGALAPLVHTPRAAKRLVNTYQLVRVTVDDVPASWPQRTISRCWCCWPW